MVEDIYIFKYNECEKDNNKITDYFKVICLHNTNQFITIFPICDGEYLPHIDLNYLIEKDEEKEPIKKISRIDKFNKKYNLK